MIQSINYLLYDDLYPRLELSLNVFDVLFLLFSPSDPCQPIETISFVESMRQPVGIKEYEKEYQASRSS